MRASHLFIQRRTALTRLCTAAEEDAAAGKGKRTVKEKVPFSIDFSTPATVSSKELFEPGTKTATMLPKSKRKVTDNHMLPDDMHFNSSQLLRLFLKPKAMVRPVSLP